MGGRRAQLNVQFVDAMNAELDFGFDPLKKVKKVKGASPEHGSAPGPNRHELPAKVLGVALGKTLPLFWQVI